MSETVYFFDHLQKLIKRKNTRSLIEVSQEKEISSDKSDLLKDTLYVTTKYDKEIEDARYMAIRENESSFSLYRITKVSDPSETLEFTGLGFATNELDAYIIKDIRPSGQPLKNVLDQLIPGLAGLLLTFLCMWLLKKKVSPIWIIIGIFIVGILGHVVGLL